LTLFFRASAWIVVHSTTEVVGQLCAVLPFLLLFHGWRSWFRCAVGSNSKPQGNKGCCGDISILLCYYISTYLCVYMCVHLM
jgi:hypothetical protein